MTWVVKSEGAYLVNIEAAVRGAGHSADGLCAQCGAMLGFADEQKLAKRFEDKVAAKVVARKVNGTVVHLLSKREYALSRLVEETEPTASVMVKSAVFCDLLSLVVEEYVYRDLVSLLTRDERYKVAKWATVSHLAAGFEDPTLPAPEPPPELYKVVLMPGRRVVVDGMGMGTIDRYGYKPEGIACGLHKQAVVTLDSGETVFCSKEVIAGVFY